MSVRSGAFASRAKGEEPFASNVGTPRPVVAFLVNGGADGAMAVRARSFKERMSTYDVHIAYRQGGKVAATQRFLKWLYELRPDLVYVIDLAAAGVLAALLYKKLSSVRIVVDTGDAVTELARAIGRSPSGIRLTEWLETTAFSHADAFVVRGRNHSPLLAAQGVADVTVIPDGVDSSQFYPRSVSELRRELGLDEAIVIGTLGSSVWNERSQSCYGWELPDVVHRLRDLPVKALLVGGGDGVERVRAKALRLGVEDRVVCVGPIPYGDLPDYLCAMDIALSKQTNDTVGQVRTTGKLPLYLACGRFVLGTRVGEAAHILSDEHLIDYDGTDDVGYTERLWLRIEHLAAHPELLAIEGKLVQLAQKHFEYDLLAERLQTVCDRVLASRKI